MTIFKWLWNKIRPVYGAGIDERPTDLRDYGLDPSQPLGVRRGVPILPPSIQWHLDDAERNLQEARRNLQRARAMLVSAVIGVALQIVVVLWHSS